jgi:glutaredoxin-like protein
MEDNMPMLDDKVKQEVKKILENMVKPITVKLFTQEMECGYCKETHDLLIDVASLNAKISLQIHDFAKDTEAVAKYGIEQIPAIVVEDEKDRNIKFYGIPAGYEFSSLLNALLMVSTGVLKLTAETKAWLDYNKQPINLQVFVTPTCPYCPAAVILAHQMAYYSDNVKAEMVEVSEFPHLAVKYGVQGVPRTTINGKEFVEGAAPEAMLLEKIKLSI